MTTYLKPTDPMAFKGLTKKLPAEDRMHECLECHGFGGWILQQNTYGPGQHFKASCSNCNGWGYTKEKEDHIHDFKELTQATCRERGIAHFGMCYHVHECAICGRIRAVDSSG